MGVSQIEVQNQGAKWGSQMGVCSDHSRALHKRAIVPMHGGEDPLGCINFFFRFFKTFFLYKSPEIKDCPEIKDLREV
jgi:hypothetical protein